MNLVLKVDSMHPDLWECTWDNGLVNYMSKYGRHIMYNSIQEYVEAKKVMVDTIEKTTKGILWGKQ